MTCHVRRLSEALLVVLGVAISVQAGDAKGRAQTSGRTLFIQGRVTAHTTGDPIAGAKVAAFKLDSTSAELPLALTDDGGGFTIDDLAPGDYGLTVRIEGQTGWVDPEAGLRPGASLDGAPDTVELLMRRVSVAPGRSNTVAIDLVRAPTVSGRVTDERGAGVSAASVCALRQQAIAGRREWVSGNCTPTDADGRYRVVASAGTVILSAAVSTRSAREHAQGPGASYTLQRTFLPDTTDISTATTSELEWDDVQSDVNLTMRRVNTVRVSGRIVGASPGVARPYGHLMYADALLRRLDSFASSSAFDGMKFQFDGVPPGDYVIETPDGFLKDESGQPLAIRHAVTVDRGDIINLEVQAEPCVRLRGRVVFDGRSAAPEAASDLGVTRVYLGPPDAGAIGDVMPATAPIESQGEFASIAQPPGKYLVSVIAPPAGWRLRSAMAGGRDAADAPLDLQSDFHGAVVTMTNHPAGLHGRVLTRRGDASPFTIVLVYPANRAQWTDFGLGRRFRSLVTGGDGTFSIGELPAGDYLVAAVMNVPDSGWRDEIWLTALRASSTLIRVTEGVVTNASLIVRTAPVR